MDEKKLTDEEILQGLECLSGVTLRDCDNSSFMDGYFSDDFAIARNARDLIHRLQAENAKYEQKLDDGELVSKDWHDEQVGHLQAENDRLNDMKFTQEHCDLYKENEWLKAELKRELAEREEFTQKAKAEIERLTEREKFLENAWHISLENANTLDIALDASRAREQEYKKQVDELKEQIMNLKTAMIDRVAMKSYDTMLTTPDDVEEIFGDAYESEFNKFLGEAVKDTAKEILLLSKDTPTYCDFVKAIKERYGVEVE